MSEKPEYRAVPIEAETAKYNPEEIKDTEKRKTTAQDIGNRKATIGYNKETPDGRETLSKEWMKKARLSEAQIKAIDNLVGITEDDDATVRDRKRKEWQSENGVGTGPDRKGLGDGIFGWESLEKLDQAIEARHQTEAENKAYEQSSNGDEAVENPYANDKTQTGLEYYDTEEYRAEETKEQEKEKEEEKQEKMSKFYTEHGDTDFDVALLEEAGIDEVEYNNYKTGRKEENETKQREQLTSLKDKLNNASTENYYGSTENSEFGGNKLKTTQLPNGPLVYESTEGPNKGEYLNLETGEFDLPIAFAEGLASEEDRKKEEQKTNERIKNISNINGTPLKENEWSRIGTSVYFRNGESLIAIAPEGNLREQVDGEWRDLDFSSLPKETQEAALKGRMDYFNTEYGENKVNATGTLFKDTKMKDAAKLDDFLNSGGTQGRLEGKIAGKMIDSLVKSRKDEAPKMGELTWEQYQQFQEKPESFATSDFVKNAIQTRGPNASKVSNETFVDPEEYGIPSKMVYARRGDAIISKPKEGEPTIENIMIAGPTGEFQTQKKWLETVKVEPGKQYDVYGMPGSKFSKNENGDITIYEGTVEKSRYEVATNTWKEGGAIDLASK